MNAAEVLDNSHLMIIEAVDHLPELEWDIPNACEHCAQISAFRNRQK